ncbi:hypothetical protein ZYGR_0AF00930 [Zygosaccharomyces rouxii]|uniref:Uncharacterized protein n=1 Tax=Zygosaccharomyces rouxii TaxID=4956 RepID=A0A1Q3A7D4_ZYGRO|nr:hypothetical protein ZYGR_0AF00930 [Zygosaccharomyces rouxii]
MQGMPSREQKYIQRGKSLKHYIAKLRNAFKNNKIVCMAKKDLEAVLEEKEKPSSNRFNRPRKRSLTNANKATSTTPTRMETQPAKTQDSPEWKRQKKTSRDHGKAKLDQNGRKRHNARIIRNSLASEQSKSSHEHAGRTPSRCPKNPKPHGKKTHLEEVKNLTLDDIQEHPMLQQELTARIDGSYIQFHLVGVDPKLLLQGPPAITTEPMPSLIWPYD